MSHYSLLSAFIGGILAALKLGRKLKIVVSTIVAEMLNTIKE